MSQIVVFLGPSLPLAEARALLDADYRPPAAQGDLLRAALEVVDRGGGVGNAVALVDGVFETQPSPWHKEILWALSRGVHVFGASSLGALRAVETERFGTVGVGRVVEAYRAGLLQGDDEVALRHGPAASGYLAVSVPLVDLRTTLAAALADQTLERSDHDALLARTAALPFPERTWARLEADARGALAPQVATRFLDWLPSGKLSQKAEDTRALLQRLATFRADPPPPLEPRWTFRHTVAFDTLFQRARREATALANSERDGEERARARSAPGTRDPLLDELRLDPDRYVRRRDQARLDDAFDQPADELPIDESLVARELLDWRAHHGLEEPDAVGAFLARQGLDERSLRELLTARARQKRRALSSAPRVLRRLVLRLRLDGAASELADRAACKAERLRRAGLEQPRLADLHSLRRSSGGRVEDEPTEDDLWVWWRESTGDRGANGRAWTDPAETAAALDLESVEALRRLLLRDACYRELEALDAAAPSDPLSKDPLSRDPLSSNPVSDGAPPPGTK